MGPKKDGTKSLPSVDLSASLFPHFQVSNYAIWKIVPALRQVFMLLVPLLITVYLPLILLQPILKDRLSSWAELLLASDEKVFPLAAFILITAAVCMVPGLPVLSVIALLGSNFDLLTAFWLGTVARQLAACASFFIGQRFLRARLLAMQERWTVLKALKIATEKQPRMMSLLVRFVMVPEQVKNYSLGAVGTVPFSTFFLCTLIGDLQGTVFSVLTGFVSAHPDGFLGFVPALGMANSIIVMLAASLYAKRICDKYSKLVLDADTAGHVEQGRQAEVKKSLFNSPQAEWAIKQQHSLVPSPFRPRRRSINAVAAVLSSVDRAGFSKQQQANSGVSRPRYNSLTSLELV